MKPLLALVTLLLAGVLGLQWWGWPQERSLTADAGFEEPVLDPSSQGEQAVLDEPAPLADREEYAVVIERPLFLPDRRPPSDEPEVDEAAAPTVDTNIARLDLNAVLITPDESSAWVRDAAKKEVLRLRPGDQMEGWSVREILSDRLVLERQGETNTLILWDYKNMPAQPKRDAGPGARRTPRARQRTPKSPQPTPGTKRSPRPPPGTGKPPEPGSSPAAPPGAGADNSRMR